MVLAASYPFFMILLSTLVFVGFVMWVFIAISIFSDLFRRQDIGGFTKAIWIVLIIALPLLGTLVYLIVNNRGMTDRQQKNVEAAQAAFDQHVREAAGTGGPAGEIDTAQKLLAAGTISQAEFDSIKAKALAR